MIRVFIVDDHTILRDGLRRSFADCPDLQVVGEAGSAAELFPALKASRPQVVLLDIRLPDAGGLSLIKRIRAVRPAPQVVVLTMFDGTHFALQALDQGAAGFMLKDCPFSELQEAIRQVHRGQTYVCRALASQLLGRLRQPTDRPPLERLSARELEVLVLLSQGLALKEVGARLGIAAKTVGTFRARLMTKLALRTNTELVRFALEAGLLA